MKISVSAPAGLEGVTKRELYNLIKVDASAINGRLQFDGDIKTVAFLNLHMRTASRVYIVIGSFKVSNFDDLFDGVKNLNFEDYVSDIGQINVYGTAVESTLMSTSACASIIKKAICTRLESVYKKPLLESGERYRIEFNLRRDYLTISLDTSGEGLHKRGYRKNASGDAPLKENVAGALLSLSVWNKSKPFADLFCGSGTLPIECAMKAKNIPAGLNRDFDFLHYKNFDLSFYSQMLESAKSQIDNNYQGEIFACDIDAKQIERAKYHARLAGVGEIINFKVQDMREFSSTTPYGVIVTNPPYGERLLTRNEIVSLYKDYGKTYQKLDKWSAYTLTSVTDFERLFGKKALKKRKVFNGKLECWFYQVMGEKPQKN